MRWCFDHVCPPICLLCAFSVLWSRPSVRFAHLIIWHIFQSGNRVAGWAASALGIPQLRGRMPCWYLHAWPGLHAGAHLLPWHPLLGVCAWRAARRRRLARHARAAGEPGRQQPARLHAAGAGGAAHHGLLAWHAGTCAWACRPPSSSTQGMLSCILKHMERTEECIFPRKGANKCTCPCA